MQEIKGLFFRDFSTAYWPEILKEIYRERIYAPYLEQRKDQVIMDIGGNVGLFTHYAYDYAKKIYIVEPSAQHFEVINKMLIFNKMTDKVTSIKRAISHEDGEAKFYHSDNTTMFSLKEAVNSKPEEVETVIKSRLDSLFKEFSIEHVDFMKLDIEGSECEVIGGEGFANVADKIDSMVIEWHTWSGRNPSQIVTTLHDLGFKTKIIPSAATLIGATKL